MRSKTLTEPEREQISAQYLVCSHLLRACPQAMYDIALENDDQPAVRKHAIDTLKSIHEDWLQARKVIRRRLEPREAPSSRPLPREEPPLLTRP